MMQRGRCDHSGTILCVVSGQCSELAFGISLHDGMVILCSTLITTIQVHQLASSLKGLLGICRRETNMKTLESVSYITLVVICLLPISRTSHRMKQQIH